MVAQVVNHPCNINSHIYTSVTLLPILNHIDLQMLNSDSLIILQMEIHASSPRLITYNKHKGVVTIEPKGKTWPTFKSWHRTPDVRYLIIAYEGFKREL